MKFGDVRTRFILWNDIQPGMAFIRPFEGILHFVEAVSLPFVRVRQSMTGDEHVINSWRGIQALDYSVPTEETLIRESFDRFLTPPKLPDIALSCDQGDMTINIFTEIEHGKTETGKTPLEELLFDITLRESIHEKYSGRKSLPFELKNRLVEFPSDVDFQPKRREEE